MLSDRYTLDNRGIIQAEGGVKAPSAFLVRKRDECIFAGGIFFTNMDA